MAMYPLAVLPWVEQQFHDNDGNPLAAGRLYFWIAGTSTPLPVYSDPDGESEMTQPVILDSTGRPEDGMIFISATGYKISVANADDEVLYVRTAFMDVGQYYANNVGLVASAGSRNVTSGYQVLSSDRMVTVNSAGGPDPCVVILPAASAATQPVTIKNLGSIALEITPNGTDTIETLAAPFDVPAASNPNFPTVTLISDNVSAWLIQSSHGMA